MKLSRRLTYEKEVLGSVKVKKNKIKNLTRKVILYFSMETKLIIA